MRRIAFIALAAAAACGEVTEQAPGPTDRFYFPSGMAVHAGKVVVASTNFDLQYDPDTGGSVIAVDPADPATVTGAMNIQSFAGELAIADPTRCPAIRSPELGAIAIVPVRGVGSVYQIRVSDSGALACDDCATQVGTPSFADPFAVGLACDGPIARAYVGYLRSSGDGWITQIDLTMDPSAAGAVQSRALGKGEYRGFAYDAGRQRLWATQSVAGTSPALRWVDLGDGCRFDSTAAGDPDGEPCATGVTVAGAIPAGLEPRELALASCLSLPAADPATCRDATARRVYLTTRIYDPALSGTSGGRVGDFGGRLLVADLVETLDGGMTLDVVRQLDVGAGAGDVVVLPPSPARAGQRDVVAALGAATGVLLLYDDEKGTTATPFGTDPNGAPLIGRDAFGLAVDPDASGGGIARLYLGSFEDDFVAPIDVPLADIGFLEEAPPTLRRITGGAPATGGTP